MCGLDTRLAQGFFDEFLGFIGFKEHQPGQSEPHRSSSPEVLAVCLLWRRLRPLDYLLLLEGTSYLGVCFDPSTVVHVSIISTIPQHPTFIITDPLSISLLLFCLFYIVVAAFQLTLRISSRVFRLAVARGSLRGISSWSSRLPWPIVNKQLWYTVSTPRHSSTTSSINYLHNLYASTSIDNIRRIFA